MVSARNSDQQTIKDGTAEETAVKAIAKLAQIHLQMLRAGAVIGAVDERLCIAGDSVEPLQMLAIRVEILSLVNIAVFQRFAIAFESIRLNHGPESDIF